MAMQKFLIIDDHPLFREAMQIVVQSVYPKAEIHEATGIDAAVEMMSGLRHGYDLAFLDLIMPGTSGFDGLLLMRSKFPHQPVLIVSAHDDPHLIQEALSYGISGFVSKSAKKAELAHAITVAISGLVYLPDWYERAAPTLNHPENAELISRLASLTPQQLRVLQMLRRGKLNKQIARELDITETTVKAHVSGILHKLHLYSRTQVVIEVARIDFGEISGNDDASLLYP
jgi:DNA-binding NarL/FixJ family response regulator